MHLSALHHARPLLDLTTNAKRVSVATFSDVPEANDTFQQSLAAFPPEASSSPDVPLPTAEVANAAGQAAFNSAVPSPQDSLTEIATQHPAATATGSLLNSVKSYTAASQDSSQAYQEYAKAWGGRVVHGQVELPPLSIYLE